MGGFCQKPEKYQLAGIIWSELFIPHAPPYHLYILFTFSVFLLLYVLERLEKIKNPGSTRTMYFARLTLSVINAKTSKFHTVFFWLFNSEGGGWIPGEMPVSYEGLPLKLM